MEINDLQVFLDYYSKVRQRTMRVIKCIPPDKLEWTYKEGKFTLGDLVRHIAAIERFMYGETVQNKPSAYNGCGKEFADGYDEVIVFVEKCHKESMEIFQGLSPEQLNGKCTTPGGVSITTWKWLRAMVEHEVHHRGQIFTYLGMLGVATYPLYGLTAEEVQQRSITK